MNKKIIFILSGVLIFIVIFTIILSTFSKKTNQTQTNTTTQENKATDLLTTEKNPVPTKSTQTTVENNTNFKVEYSSQTNKYTVTKKTVSADEKVSDWLTKNNLSTSSNNVSIIDESETSNLAANPELSLSNSSTSISPTVFSLSPTKTTDESAYENNSKVLVDLVSILLNIGSTDETTDTTASTSLSPTSILTLSPTSKKTAGSASTKYVYYAQCGGSFDNYALPSGCTICAAGCGPTTVAMIAASYIDKSITPKTVVDLYKQKGYFLGCAGSRTTDAKAALTSYGIKTTDYMTFSSATIDTAAQEFKSYLNNGWTIFVLTYFCDGGCGHFFWITALGGDNATWAYDPYYGKGQTPPINEKTRYPFPKYRIAFGVKK